MSRYSAFISYSHTDDISARWLHHALETYRIPRTLVGQNSGFGPVPRRLPPVFRDRDELAASGDLGNNLRNALAGSRFQIVLCSPNAAKSHWVNEEIIAFKRLHGEDRTLAVILSGEPYAGGEGECFPSALRFHLDSDGQLSHVPAEPIAADMRTGKDGKKLSLLKLIAGIAGVSLDGLVRRDAARRQRRLVAIATISTCIAALTIGLAIYAESQRRVAVRQQQLAERSLAFLIGTFSIANPATENPRTMTVMTILNRASHRAVVELRDEPQVSARLLRTTGEIYNNLGLVKEAERDLQGALAREQSTGEERARTLLKLFWVAYKRGDAVAANSYTKQASLAYDPKSASGPELLAETTEERGMAAKLAGRNVESASLLARSALLYQKINGDQRQALGRIWMNEAQVLLKINQFAEAEKLLARAESTYIALFGNNHVLTGTVIQNRALADLDRGKVESASARIQEALAIYSRVLDHDHPTIGAALILEGRIHTAQGDFKRALIEFDRARTLYARLYGMDNPAVADSDFYAAKAEAGLGNTEGALMRLSRTKRIYDKSYGPDDPDQLELLTVRLRILLNSGRLAAARSDCIAAFALQKRLKSSEIADEDVDACRRIEAAPRISLRTSPSSFTKR